ncbi:MAG: galactokinase [Clostridia bacterium]|nr:galactokinase [Clostridia bacterium]
MENGVNERDYAYKVTAAGRVNLIGEHIDYCGGKVLPAALSLCNAVYVRPNGTNKINLRWTTLPDEVTLDIDKLEEYRTLKYGNYQAGSALFWRKGGHALVGCDMLQDCKVPFGSGLSSSAAIEVSTIAALAAVAGEEFDPVEVALTAQRAEREFAGVNCGIMDQYASACGKKGRAVLLDCNTLQREYIPLALGEYSLVIINCNKPHSLVESKYNERRAETQKALQLLQERLNVSCLAEVTSEQLSTYQHLLPEKIYARAKHVVTECERVEKAVIALKDGGMPAFGKLLNESHASLRDLYEVTGKELDALQEAAVSYPDCIGARMTGGGFGGCVISLVKTEKKESFKAYVSEVYRKKIGYAPSCYEAEISDGITVAKL